jgi:dTDP-4-dehydrorhamnose 3,5-epimerase-like enzyme
MEIRKVDQVISDKRGTLIQVTSAGKWKQLNVLTRKAGSLGGGHYHRKAVEFFYVIKGKVEVKTISVQTREVQHHTFHDNDCFVTLPMEQHYMKFHEDTTIAALYSEIYEGKDDDTLVDTEMPSLQSVFNAPHE